MTSFVVASDADLQLECTDGDDTVSVGGSLMSEGSGLGETITPVRLLSSMSEPEWPELRETITPTSSLSEGPGLGETITPVRSTTLMSEGPERRRIITPTSLRKEGSGLGETITPVRSTSSTSEGSERRKTITPTSSRKEGPGLGETITLVRSTTSAAINTPARAASASSRRDSRIFPEVSSGSSACNKVLWQGGVGNGPFDSDPDWILRLGSGWILILDCCAGSADNNTK